jgi:hypothetical protein
MRKLLILGAAAAAIGTWSTGAAVAQQDTLYGPRGFLGGVRPDAAEIIRYCQARSPRNWQQCARAEAKRRPVTR